MPDAAGCRTPPFSSSCEPTPRTELACATQARTVRKISGKSALELINDDSSVPWTMFNDNVQMGFFDVYDQYLVNILYDPRVRPGMRKGEVDSAKLVM